MLKKIEPKDIALRRGTIKLQGVDELKLTIVGTEADYEGIKAKWLTHYARFVVSVVDAEPFPPPAQGE